MMEQGDLDDVSDEVIEEKLLDRPITTLRDVLYTYGGLYELSYGEVDEYFAYLTPSESSDLVGESESLIAIEVDLDDDPSVDGVSVQTYTESLIPRVAHCEIGSSRGTDHSVTQKTSLKPSASRVGDYARFALEWVDEALIEEFYENELEGSEKDVFKKLSRIANDDNALETVAERVENQITDDKSPALTTLRIKMDGEWKWPGEIEVIQEAMKYRWSEKQATKNNPHRPSRGSNAPGQVIGDDADTLVGTVATPLNYFRSKQRETYYGLDESDSWLSHPISLDAISRVDNSGDIVENCYHNIFGFRSYHLPYVSGEMTADDARKLYDALAEILNSDANPLTESFFDDRLGDGVGLDFYTVIVEYDQNTRYRVYGEEPLTDTVLLGEIAESHVNAIESTFLSGDAPFLDAYEGGSDDESGYLTRQGLTASDVYSQIANGTYLLRTMDDPLEDSDKDLTATDPRVTAQKDLISGSQIEYEFLIEQFQKRVDSAAADADRDEFPTGLVSQQLAQLIALDDNDMLSYSDSLVADSNDKNAEKLYTPSVVSIMTDEPETREEKLAQFLEEAPVLQESHERRGAFLIGATVGLLSQYQDWNDVSDQMRDRYPVQQLTLPRLQRAHIEATDRANVYASEEDAVLLYKSLFDRLNDAVVAEEIPSWDISKEELRHYYSVGLTYGLTDYTSAGHNEQTDN